MNKGTIGTVIGVILAIVIAWVVVEFLLKLTFFFLKLGLVALVALIVFFALRALLNRRR